MYVYQAHTQDFQKGGSNCDKRRSQTLTKAPLSETREMSFLSEETKEDM